ncbi:glycogen debranching N-terminal domain-containing protein [Haloarcula litorea]|uniref:amylo-alpha-1,6-glucosidase n=1 Tax=Haloarcula litorea TaxID=3032579 RepID=UPI0023E8CBDB|nr:glycogen debranching N-terminal domain-containing protein [Halomicroarcula sp. GDY20]
MTEEVLVDGHTFLVTDEAFALDGTGGLFHRDTRYLSDLSVSVEGTDLAPVGSTLQSPWRRRVTYADAASTVNKIDESEEQKHTTLALTRDQVVAEGLGLVERVHVTNHARSATTVQLSVDVDADFENLFEVRDLSTGIDREIERSAGDDRIGWRYDPADAGGAATTVWFDRAPETLTSRGATCRLPLASQASETVTVAALPGGTDGPVEASLFDRAVEAAGGPELGVDAAALAGSRYGTLFERAVADLRALVTATDHGPVPLAGVPWFATVFGRDALLTAYNAVPVAPTLAAGTLRYLAAHQGTGEDPYREEAPGKIFHEIRQGELAERGEIPHTPYYGTVDATPLWLVVLDETRRWTGDESLVDDLWAAAQRAVDWLDRATDRGREDPFLYYREADSAGLVHKAWRDTERSVQFADGRPADAPLASAEVQGYVYDAYRRTAAMARERDQYADAREYERRAERLAERFDAEFWLPEREYYGTALTGDGRVVDSTTSNVGHCLWSGLVPDERAGAVVDTLLDDGLNSGWGVRTMSSEDAGYSPVSYHVGSVWPHDNALVALGTADYGFHEAAERVATGVLEACRNLDRQRVPELYCGFADETPYPYPSACEPQAWGASTPVALLRALFGLDPDEGVTRTPSSLDVERDAVAALVDGADATVAAGGDAP